MTRRIDATIEIRRGLRADLPTSGMALGEPFFCTDTGEFFIWNGTQMMQIIGSGGVGGAVLLVPTADQKIIGVNALILQGPNSNSYKIILSNDGNVSTLAPITVHSPYANGIDLFTHSEAGYKAPFLNFARSKGTEILPTAVTYEGFEINELGGITFQGYDGAQYYQAAMIFAYADENWSPTNHGASIHIYGTSAGAGANTQEFAQFGGVGPNGESNSNIIFFRGLSFQGGQAGNPALNPTSNPPVIHVRTADDSGDAALTASKLKLSALSVHANNAAAIAASLVAGDLYRTGGDPDAVCIVH